MDENKKKKLAESLVRGKLGDVIDAYMEFPEIRELQIKRTGDTALHVAISDERERLASRMISVSERNTLAIMNRHGDTALHLAAKAKDPYLCKLLMEKDQGLIDIHNESGETAIFSAVESGKIQTFLYLLHNSIVLTTGFSRDNGDTILHSAIYEEHFDMAYVIISLYPELVHQVNNEGLSALHLLAAKPSVFPSRVQLFGIRKLVYHCVRVRKMAVVKLRERGRSCFLLPSSTFYIFSCRFMYRLKRRDTTWKIVAFIPCVLIHILLNAAFHLIWLPFRLAKYTSGYAEYVRIKNIKRKCIWSVDVMNKLIPDDFKYAEGQEVESPIFMAAKHGISEMVLRILDVNPGSILDENAEKKNIIMLAVEHRHTHLYEDLITNWNFKKTIFGQRDTQGNSLLHIAAHLEAGQQFWRIRGAALQMHMEIKWFKFIRKSMPPRFFARCNNDNKTSKEIFQESHQHLIEEGRQWLTNTAQSCSLVAALIATVAFATSATIPGGLKQDNGVPSLEHKPFFIVSATSSLVALSSSMMSVVMFLGILTSNFKLKDFRRDLPHKYLMGLISLLISIVSMFISFYAGHYFVLKQELRRSATLVYASLCSIMLFFIIAKFPLGFEIVWTTLRTKPRN